MRAEANGGRARQKEVELGYGVGEAEEGFGVFGGDFGDFFEGSSLFFGEPEGDILDMRGVVNSSAVGDGGKKGGVGFEEGAFEGREREVGKGGETVDADVEVMV